MSVIVKPPQNSQKQSSQKQPSQKQIHTRTLLRGVQADFIESTVCTPTQLIEQLYALRGFTPEKTPSSQDALYSLSGLLKPAALKGLDTACARICDAIINHQKIVIVGDFDCDGATSTALSIRAMRAFGYHNIDFLVPNRFEYGYGLTPEIVDVAKTMAPQLIVTVDNGIASVEGVNRANALGIDVVVTDHHLPPEKLPNAHAIVNPNQHGCDFGSKNLAGVGVMFYVLCAVRTRLIDQNWFVDNAITPPNMAQYLDIVALGTVADVVPLDFNNRILVEQGLKRIRAGRCCEGIKALFEVAGKDSRLIQAQDMGFVAGPRLNAAGRLDDISIGIGLLLDDNPTSALAIASELDDLNKERRQIERSMQVEAESLLTQLNDHIGRFSVCLYQDDWHQGVIGILASRIKEKHYKPTIIFAQASDTELKGSGRSVEGVHLRDVLDIVATSNPGMLSKFGGHAMAAGLSLDIDKLDAFKTAFDQAVNTYLKGEAITPAITTDGALPDHLLNLEVAYAIDKAGPWGQGFLAPLFCNTFTVVTQKIVGQNHLKLILSVKGNPQHVIDAIVFNVDVTQWPDLSCTAVRLVYSLDINRFRGRQTVQLIGNYIEAL